MINAALVLEGGSLRCLFTAGVLDVMLEQGIEFTYVNGVSAGSMSGMNYISKQVKRTAQVNLEFVNDKRYLSIRNIFQNGGIFNFDFLFGEISEKLLPFDFETFQKSNQELEVIATNCATGKEEYFSKQDCEDIFIAARASSSLPLLSQKIKINDYEYLDGGIALPVAFKRPMEKGFDKIVVVLTREKGYRKKSNRKILERACGKIYADYPKLLERIYNVPDHYNELQVELEQLQQEGKIFIIRPEEPVLISRVEKNVEKLEDLYNKGRTVMEKNLEDLKSYLEIE